MEVAIVVAAMAGVALEHGHFGAVFGGAEAAADTNLIWGEGLAFVVAEGDFFAGGGDQFCGHLVSPWGDCFGRKFFLNLPIRGRNSRLWNQLILTWMQAPKNDASIRLSRVVPAMFSVKYSQVLAPNPLNWSTLRRTFPGILVTETF